MLKEIERKFLVKGDYKSKAKQSTRVTQGYLSSVIERTVRVRIKGNKGFITIKGISEDGGVSRFEWEKEIPVGEAEELLKICEPCVIDKIRHLVPVGNHVYEVDEFFGDNEGLVVAEVELNSVDEQFDKPEWLGREVTGDAKYYNSMLSRHPYKNWSE